MAKVKITVDNKEYDVNIEELDQGKLKVSFNGESHEVKVEDHKSQTKEKDTSIKAPMPGIISEIHVKQGDKVKPGQNLISLIAMKMENQITSPLKAKIKEIKVKAKDTVEADQVLMVLE